jgi:hypothetical protein
MSFQTGTQCELLYSMPASGSAVTAAVITAMSGTTAANPPYQLPANFFAPQSGTTPGKALLIKGGGSWATPTATRTTAFTVGLDTTAGTLGITLAKTGTLTTAITTATAAFDFEVMVTMTGQGQASLAGTLNAVGWIEYGIANNAATGAFGTMTFAGNMVARFMIGTPQTAVTYTTSQAYFVEVFNTWDATTNAPTITLTNFYVFGLN